MMYLNKNKGILYYFLFFNYFFSFSQKNIETYNKLIEKDFYSKPLEAKKNCFNLLHLAKFKKDHLNEAYALFYLAELCGSLSQKDSCLIYYDKAIQKSNKNNDINSTLIFQVNKANYLLNEYDLESAFNLFENIQVKAEEINNQYMYDYIELKKGVIFLETNRHEEAVLKFKNALNNKTFDKNIILETYLNLSKAYLKIDENNNSLFNSQKGYEQSVNFNSQFEIHFLNIQGMAYLKEKKLDIAEIKFKKALQKSINTNYYEMSRLININISKAYTLQGRNIDAIKILKKILKNEQNIVIATENKYEIYHLLAENYKLINDQENSNNFYELFIEESKKINSKRIKNIELLLKSDIEKLNDQKNNLKNQKIYLWLMIFFLVSLLILFIIHKRKLKSNNTKKFNDLLEKIKNIEKNNQFKLTEQVQPSRKDETIQKNLEAHNQQIKIEDNINDTKSIINIENQTFAIKDNTISEILDGLKKLEKKEYFLKQECTLNNVARKLKTNTAYLSKVINNELGKSFSSYINELRINYVLIELKNNKKLRSYSINAISEEIGYKSPESFTKYFKTATGLTPAIFIKKINSSYIKKE